MLGVSSSPAWRSVAVPLAAGEQLVVYTDGVIEAKRSGGERFGTDRLRTGLEGSEGPDSAVERVRAALAGFGGGRRDDDAALVAIQREPQPDSAPTAPGLTARSTSEASRAPSLG
jgi:serine phosphatase RsbU (regulator of sigma subunit)